MCRRAVTERIHAVAPGFGCRLVVLFVIGNDEIADREDAKKLGNMELQISEEDLPELEVDEFYFYELKGFAVIDEEGNDLGTVREIFDNHGQALLSIENQNGDIKLPSQLDSV